MKFLQWKRKKVSENQRRESQRGITAKVMETKYPIGYWLLVIGEVR
jgi:hypothetical protein